MSPSVRWVLNGPGTFAALRDQGSNFSRHPFIARLFMTPIVASMTQSGFLNSKPSSSQKPRAQSDLEGRTYFSLSVCQGLAVVQLFYRKWWGMRKELRKFPQCRQTVNFHQVVLHITVNDRKVGIYNKTIRNFTFIVRIFSNFTALKVQKGWF